MWRFEPDNNAVYHSTNFYEGKQLRFLHVFNLVYAIIYLVIHYVLSVLYQNTRCDVVNGIYESTSTCTDWAQSLVKGEGAKKFESDFNNLPTMIAFLMGFYVNMVVVRWWDQVCNDSKLLFVTFFVPK